MTIEARYDIDPDLTGISRITDDSPIQFLSNRLDHWKGLKHYRFDLTVRNSYQFATAPNHDGKHGGSLELTRFNKKWTNQKQDYYQYKTLFGTDSRDVIYETQDYRYLGGWGEYLDETLKPVSQNIYGGGGNDTIIAHDLQGYSDSVKSYLNGDPSSINQFHGEAGNDILKGNAFQNLLYGGTGNDTLDGGGGDDFLSGNEDNDKLWGGDGEDQLFGGIGNDILVGGDGYDEIDAGDGDDTIFLDVPIEGNNKGDYVIGGTGADTFVIGGTTMTTTTTTTTTPYDWKGTGLGATTDVMGAVIDGTGLGVASKVTKGVVGAVIDIFKGAESKNVETTTVESVPGNIATGNYIQITDFNPREDVIVIPISAELSNVGRTITDDNLRTLELYYKDSGRVFAEIKLEELYKLYNNDEVALNINNRDELESVWESVLDSSLYLGTYDANDSSPTIKLGTTTENFKNADGSLTEIKTTVSELDANYMVIGAYAGANILTSGKDDDLWGTDYNDVLVAYPTASNKEPQHNEINKLYGFNGDDILAGGAGADYYFGGDGTDIVSYADDRFDDNDSNGITVNLADSLEGNKEDYAYLDPESEKAIFSWAWDVYADPLDPDQADKLFSIEGIIGSKWDDSIKGDKWNNIFNGGDGNDTLEGGAGNDTLIGGEGEDTLEGGGGNDTLIGGAGSDTLIGDVVAGNDTLIVDAGADTFVLDTTEGGIDTIRGFSLAENDVLLIDNKSLGTSHAKARNLNGMLSATGLKLQLGNVGIATIENVDSSNVHRVLGRVEFTTSSHINTPLGLGDDLLATGDGNDRLTGGSGDDLLSGGAGNDTLLGGTHKDLLLGGRGDDLLNGGKGIDRLYGGSGADTFVINNTVSGLNKRAGIDVIQDFSVDEFDHIQIDASVFGIGINDHHLVQLGNDSFLRVNNSKIAQLTGVDVNTFVTDEHVDLV
ncbi:calcium-binding protein [Acaryochloris marina]|uniref:calcium-binding protein n=1 Tax=Acaryochloris marina TaxID=155978 RepID=UPI0021C41745|nr:calcium-binding protein [Acaryochloris marina]BDM83533.1 hypothetical protein AM10699_63940 [Acaryochloris marina MBIC10699]